MKDRPGQGVPTDGAEARVPREVRRQTSAGCSDSRPEEAKRFYAAIVAFTLLAMGMNFFGINPMKALIFAGVVQGVSTPFLMLLVMRRRTTRESWAAGQTLAG